MFFCYTNVFVVLLTVPSEKTHAHINKLCKKNLRYYFKHCVYFTLFFGGIFVNEYEKCATGFYQLTVHIVLIYTVAKVIYTDKDGFYYKYISIIFSACENVNLKRRQRHIFFNTDGMDERINWNSRKNRNAESVREHYNLN